MKWLILILLLLIPLTVLATEDNILTFYTSDNVSLTTLCTLTNGSICKITESCFITVYYPNWTVNYTEKEMQYKTNGFYEVNFTQYQQEGDYKGFVMCNSTNPLIVQMNGRQDFRISEITKNTILGGFNMMGAVLIPIMLSVIMLVGGLLLSNEHGGLKMGLFIGSILPLFMALHLAINSTTNQALKTTLANQTTQIGIIFGFLVVYFLIYIIYVMFKSKMQLKGI